MDRPMIAKKKWLVGTIWVRYTCRSVRELRAHARVGACRRTRWHTNKMLPACKRACNGLHAWLHACTAAACLEVGRPFFRYSW